jgi:hypothetical protein
MFSGNFFIVKSLLLVLVLAVSADCVSEGLIEAALEKTHSQSRTPAVLSWFESSSSCPCKTQYSACFRNCTG